MYILPCRRITRGLCTERMERRQQKSHGTVRYIEPWESAKYFFVRFYTFNIKLKINAAIVICYQVRETRINVDNQWSLV